MMLVMILGLLAALIYTYAAYDGPARPLMLAQLSLAFVLAIAAAVI